MNVFVCDYKLVARRTERAKTTHSNISMTKSHLNHDRIVHKMIIIITIIAVKRNEHKAKVFSSIAGAVLFYKRQKPIGTQTKMINLTRNEFIRVKRITCSISNLNQINHFKP